MGSVCTQLWPVPSRPTLLRGSQEDQRDTIPSDSKPNSWPGVGEGESFFPCLEELGVEVDAWQSLHK